MMPRFTVRDLLWLILVAAVACGWLASDHRWQLTAARMAQRLAVSEAEKQELLHYWDGAQEALDDAGIEWPPMD